jgi:alkylation response protein AidB-like acyl-CoA dehydrogenase
MRRWPGATEEIEDFASVVRTLAAQRLVPRVEAMEADDALPSDVVDLLVSNEIWSVGLPDPDVGFDPTAIVVATCELAAVMPALALAVAETHLLGVAAPDAVELHAAVSDGGRIAFAPGAVEGDGPIAVRLDDARVLGGETACACLVASPGRVALVDADRWKAARGGARMARAGLRGAPSVPVTLAVDVPAEQVVDGTPVRVRRLLVLSAIAAGIASSAAAESAAYAAERHQFGGPISAIPAVAEKLTQAGDLAAALRRQVLVAAGQPEDTEAQGEVEALARAITGRLINHVSECLQVLGGYGYLTEYPLARAMRDAISVRALLLGTLTMAQDPPVAA